MKIAIIGTGISGLTCAYILNRNHEVDVYESNDYVGGHTHTVDVTVDSGSYAVDTGFIVFNHRTYPNFIKLLEQIGVDEQDTEMSFGVKNTMTGLEYRASDLNTMFAQRSNLIRPSHWGLILGMVRFGGQVSRDFEDGVLNDDETIGNYLQRNGFSQHLIDNFVVPMGAAVWSSGGKQFHEFPILTYAQFMNNHGMLTVTDHPQWKVIKGGSRSYVEPLTRSFKDSIRLSCPVHAIRREEKRVIVESQAGMETYDHVILATHSDTTLRILGDEATVMERSVLGALPYQRNDVVLHTDTSILPKSERAWASWNYRVGEDVGDLARLTYNMNMLQSIDAPETFLVSLNSNDRVDPDKVLKSFVYDHPVYTPEGQKAQDMWDEVSGPKRTWFAGAYWRFGFHEDGVMSALNVTRKLANEEI